VQVYGLVPRQLQFISSYNNCVDVSVYFANQLFDSRCCVSSELAGTIQAASSAEAPVRIPQRGIIARSVWGLYLDEIRITNGNLHASVALRCIHGTPCIFGARLPNHTSKLPNTHALETLNTQYTESESEPYPFTPIIDVDRMDGDGQRSSCRLRLVKLLCSITLFVHAGRRPGLVVRDCS
jgi:hypothetical protein